MLESSSHSLFSGIASMMLLKRQMVSISSSAGRSCIQHFEPPDIVIMQRKTSFYCYNASPTLGCSIEIVCLGPSLHKEQSHILFYLFEHFMIYVFVLVRSHLQWLLCYHISLIISMYHRIDSNILSTKFINRHSSFLIRD